MAGLAAFIIPIGTLVAGEGLAALTLERRGGAAPKEFRWREVEFIVVYRAVYVRYLQQGVPDREARGQANAEVRGYLGSGTPNVPSTVRALFARSGQAVQVPNGQADVGVKAKVRAYLAAPPDAAELSVNQLVSVLDVQLGSVQY